MNNQIKWFYEFYKRRGWYGKFNILVIGALLIMIPYGFISNMIEYGSFSHPDSYQNLTSSGCIGYYTTGNNSLNIKPSGTFVVTSFTGTTESGTWRKSGSNVVLNFYSFTYNDEI